MITNKQKGMSIVESVISMTVFSIVIVVSGQLLLSTQKTNSIIKSQVDMRRESRELESSLAYELRKALYFYPRKPYQAANYPMVIPKAVLSDDLVMRKNNENLPKSPYDTTTTPGSANNLITEGNIVTFLSVDKTSKLSDLPTIPNYITKVNTTQSILTSSIDLLLSAVMLDPTNSGLAGLGIINKMANDTKIQLVTLNCLFLRKNKDKNGLDLVLYQQKGFYNGSQAGHVQRLPYELKVSGPILGYTIDATKDLLKNKVLNQISYLLEQKNYSPLSIPLDPFTTVDIPSLDFNQKTISGITTPNYNWNKNATYNVIASNIGLKINSYIPSDIAHKGLEYRTNVNLNELNSSGITNISNVRDTVKNSDIGFKFKFDSDKRVVNIAVDLVKLSERGKSVGSHREFSVKPKLAEFALVAKESESD